jgi:hypothetical protein
MSTILWAAVAYICATVLFYWYLIETAQADPSERHGTS